MVYRAGFFCSRLEVSGLSFIQERAAAIAAAVVQSPESFIMAALESAFLKGERGVHSQRQALRPLDVFAGYANVTQQVIIEYWRAAHGAALTISGYSFQLAGLLLKPFIMAALEGAFFQGECCVYCQWLALRPLDVFAGDAYVCQHVVIEVLQAGDATPSLPIANQAAKN